MEISRVFSAVAFALVLFNVAVLCDEINFYDENGSFSMIRTMGYGGCYKFAPVWDKRATAIDIVENTSCFNVWKTADCTGESLKLTKKEGSYELRDLNFDKAISSVSLCSWDEQGRPDPMRGIQHYNKRPSYQPQSPVRERIEGRVRGEEDRVAITPIRGDYHDTNRRDYLDTNRRDNQDANRRGYQEDVNRRNYQDANRRVIAEDVSPIRGPSPSPSSVQQSSSEVWDLAVEEHNKYRKQHGAKEDLKGNPKIHGDAQAYAEFMASSNKLEATNYGNRYASNIATSFRKLKSEAVKDAIFRWFNKATVSDYELEATELGIGVAWNEREKLWVVVAFYSLPDFFYIQKFHEQTGGNIPQGRPLRIPS